ncbi:glycosyltransferase family A protein [uncultured Flavobacterium sp.]|uniref:glycosyltransferase family 2 protein n=1 Tax=uncultured Flavobacterium sp. TaxID=165435 RepID=UPI0030EDD6E2
MSLPLVSVIITTYNRNKYIEEAICSVAKQSYSYIEILVVDDGSETNYAESICKKYANCTYFYKQNGGLSSARNFGIHKAKGEFIAFLDDDDFWKSFKIEKQVNILLQKKEIDCVHSSSTVVDEDGNLTGQIIGASESKVHKRSGCVFWNALGVWVVKSPTPLIRKSVFRPDMLFDEDIKVGEDVDFYQRMFYRHKVYYFKEPLAFYREYTNEDRLSKKHEKYIGIERKMLLNFKKMGINNIFVLYRIKLTLAKSAIVKWNQFANNKKVNSNFVTLFLNPTSYINKLSKCE